MKKNRELPGGVVNLEYNEKTGAYHFNRSAENTGGNGYATIQYFKPRRVVENFLTYVEIRVKKEGEVLTTEEVIKAYFEYEKTEGQKADPGEYKKRILRVQTEQSKLREDLIKALTERRKYNRARKRKIKKISDEKKK